MKKAVQTATAEAAQDQHQPADANARPLIPFEQFKKVLSAVLTVPKDEAEKASKRRSENA